MVVFLKEFKKIEMEEFICSRREICKLIRTGKNVSEHLMQNYNLIESDVIEVEKCIEKQLISKCNQRWAKAQRKNDRFERENSAWLNADFKVSLHSNRTATSLSISGERGRPSKSYENSSEKTKKRKNMELIQEYGLEHVSSSYIQGLRSMGEHDEASIISLLRSMGNEEKKNILQNILQKLDPISSCTKEEALSLYIETDLSKTQYIYLRSFLANKNLRAVLPSYKTLSTAKNECYPPPSSITVTNISAEVHLQELLDHTVARILKASSVLTNSKRLKLYSKWGCDGSSGQSEYKQVLLEESADISDANLFIVSLVPLKLVDEENNSVVWQNPTCSSVRYCRPILIEFAKETIEKTNSVVNHMKTQISQLIPTSLKDNDDYVQVKHNLLLTMIDGKVAQVLTQTSSPACCSVCGATPKQMNDLTKVRTRELNEDSLQYGLSTLHAWIRFMEMILHISYNLSFKKWAATSDENKKIKADKKKMVQRRFREILGLHIDKPRQGSGNSNDGNTARRFFQNYECSAEITGVDVELIKKIYIILQTMSSGLSINPHKFGQYTLEIAQLYVSKYNWYHMPSSVHKILIHGGIIIEHYAILPIGQLSEDAQEARNKDYKKFRLHHARKCSRSATNEDVFHTLLYTSDPYISSLGKTRTGEMKELFDEAKALLEKDD